MTKMKMEKKPIYIKSQLFVFYRSNYDWTMKFSYTFDSPITKINFSESENIRLFTETKDHLRIFDFKLDYYSTLTNNNFSDDICNILVIAGNKLKFTPLKYGSIPPPMCYQEIQCSLKYPNFVYTAKGKFFILDTVSFKIFEESNRKIELIREIKIDDYDNIVNNGKFIIVKEFDKTLIVVLFSVTTSEDMVSIIQITNNQVTNIFEKLYTTNF